MRYLTGDIWDVRDELDGWVVIPTNTTIRRDGLAVMGAGLAKEAATRYPQLPSDMAKHIRRFKDALYVDRPIICLPTKRNWRGTAQMEWIEKGCFELAELARILSSVQHDQPILVPQLGCGLGGLNWERQVRPMVDAILEGDRFILVSK